MEAIKHIIFDLGGVLLNLDYNATVLAFEALGCKDFNAQFTQMHQNDFFDKWENGLISKENFIAEMKKHCNEKTTDEQIISAWNAMLFDIPLKRLQILNQLRNQCDLFLLSNTNEIHEEAFHKRLNEDHGIPHLGHLFDKVYFSHRVQMRKPDKEIFEWVLNEQNLLAQDTLFIDDSPQHIATAKELGIQTYYLEKGKTIEKDVFLPKK